MTSPSVLVVEDDHGLRDVLARGLRDRGFTVTCAADGGTALRLAARELDLVVLDIGLPDADGRDVCAALRARGVLAPVLFLTARDGLHDLLSGFAVGADDYLTKPFHLAELDVRLQALMRRSRGRPREGVDSLVVDGAAHAVIREGRQVSLTPIEFRLLAALVAADAMVVRRRELLRVGWPVGAIVSENTLDQYAAKLRRKLREVGSSATLVAVRGVGYRLS